MGLILVYMEGRMRLEWWAIGLHDVCGWFTMEGWWKRPGLESMV